MSGPRSVAVPCTAWDGYGVGGSVVWVERETGSCMTSGLGGTVTCVAWAGRGVGSRVTPGPAERDGKHQRTVDPGRHMGAAPCVGCHGSIKTSLGITRHSHPPSLQIRSKNPLSVVKKHYYESHVFLLYYTVEAILSYTHDEDGLTQTKESGWRVLRTATKTASTYRQNVTFPPLYTDHGHLHDKSWYPLTGLGGSCARSRPGKEPKGKSEVLEDLRKTRPVNG
ncbi:hypothetical protein B0H11DRAFT_1921723 [Mycena galericulata]|nr:hypothetical protein B0H11DRAFT_1921723 [Mycena galericulata]